MAAASESLQKTMLEHSSKKETEKKCFKILLIEDTKLMQTYIQNVFDNFSGDYNVAFIIDYAVNTELGIKQFSESLAKKERYDLIIMDHHTPAAKTGIQAALEIRNKLEKNHQFQYKLCIIGFSSDYTWEKFVPYGKSSSSTHSQSALSVDLSCYDDLLLKPSWYSEFEELICKHLKFEVANKNVSTIKPK